MVKCNKCQLMDFLYKQSQRTYKLAVVRGGPTEVWSRTLGIRSFPRHWSQSVRAWHRKHHWLQWLKRKAEGGHSLRGEHCQTRGEVERETGTNGEMEHAQEWWKVTSWGQGPSPRRSWMQPQIPMGKPILKRILKKQRDVNERLFWRNKSANLLTRKLFVIIN